MRIDGFIEVSEHILGHWDNEKKDHVGSRYCKKFIKASSIVAIEEHIKHWDFPDAPQSTIYISAHKPFNVREDIREIASLIKDVAKLK